MLPDLKAVLESAISLDFSISDTEHKTILNKQPASEKICTPTLSSTVIRCRH